MVREGFGDLGFEEESQSRVLRKDILGAKANRRGRDAELNALAEKGYLGPRSLHRGGEFERAAVFQEYMRYQVFLRLQGGAYCGVRRDNLQFILLSRTRQPRGRKMNLSQIEASNLVQAIAF